MLRIFLHIVLLWLPVQALNAQAGLNYSSELSNQLIQTAPFSTTSPLFFFSLSANYNTTSVAPQYSDPLYLPSTKPHPFFCRLEWELEKEINIPVKFRLGDVQYVDKLEGKY
ncbi:MAG: hypothetical protein GYB31_18720 [Bacteroidetes bacterium]|nr:hypothetical protein [Bacteroidota bacterium]